MLRLTSRSKRQYATEDTEYLRSKVDAFCNLFRLHIFCYSVQLKYVNTEIYDSQKMLADSSFALSKFTMNYTVRSKRIQLIPDELFGRFTEFLPLLSPNTIILSFCLVTLLFHATPSELHGAAQLGGCVFPLFLPKSPLFYRNSPFRHCVNTQSFHLRHYRMKTDAFDVS